MAEPEQVSPRPSRSFCQSPASSGTGRLTSLLSLSFPICKMSRFEEGFWRSLLLRTLWLKISLLGCLGGTAGWVSDSSFPFGNDLAPRRVCWRLSLPFSLPLPALSQNKEINLFKKKSLCQRLDSKYLRLCRSIWSLRQPLNSALSHTNSQREDRDKCNCSNKTLSWTWKSEFHILFTYHEIFFS